MNMKKALQNLYHAVSNETTTKVNISKLLVDIHYAITGKESENKNNWSKIVNSMADNWPEGGGGSSDYPTITATYDDTIQDYVYTCDWTFLEIKTKIETSAQESNSWAGIYIEVGYDGTMGGTWNITDIEGTPILQLTLTDSSTLVYDSNGNIEFVG